MSKAEKQRSLQGHWPVADPMPRIVTLLRQLSEPGMPQDVRHSGEVEARAIVDAWNAREDVAELKAALGLNSSRGRRRTQRTVDREYGIAFAAFELQARGDPLAIQRVAAETSTDEKHVRRCMDRWPVAETVVTSVREHVPGARIDYRGMLKPYRK
jgi:hypothetical protein